MNGGVSYVFVTAVITVYCLSIVAVDDGVGGRTARRKTPKKSFVLEQRWEERES
jgi:hypothetical protein